MRTKTALDKGRRPADPLRRNPDLDRAFESSRGDLSGFKLTESCGLSRLKVDRANCIIEGVKILGFTSKNGRRYTEQAVRAARQLYEGVFVNVDHPEDGPNGQRSSYDRFGKLVNVRFIEGKGLYGDLLYYGTHKLSETVIEDVERGLGGFGLSHNASGDGHTEADGTVVIEEITKVRHVDLVADPATTFSLSESIRRGRSAFDRLMEAVVGRPAKRPSDSPQDRTRSVSPAVRRLAGTLLECLDR